MKLHMKKPEFMQKAGDNGHNIFIELLIAIAVFIVASMVSSPLIGGGTMVAMLTDERYQNMIASGTMDFELVMEIASSLPGWLMVLQLFCQAFLIAACIVYCKFIEKRSLESMGFVKKNWILQYLFGAGLGIASFSLAYGACALFGCYESIVFNSQISVVMLVLYLLGYMIQGMAEEVFCRGYLMVSISRRYGVITSVLVSALVFALLHGMNAGISLLALVNLFIYGVVMSLLMVRFNNIWLVGGMHSLWNFVQGNVFGVQVSGTTLQTSVLQSVAGEGQDILDGGSFGIEGGIACTVVLLVIAVWLCISIYRKGGFGKDVTAQPAN